MNKATISVMIVAFFLCISCKEEAKSKLQAVNEDYKIKKVETQFTILDTLEGKDFQFSEILYKSQLSKNHLLVSDSRFCNIVDYDLETGEHRKYTSTDYPRVNECLHSMVESGDTTILFFIHGLTAIKILADTVFQIQSFQQEESSLHVSHNLPVKILPTPSYVVPTGRNILKNESYANENLAIDDPKEFMRGQYLLALYSSDGHLKKQFGKFPAVYQIPNQKTSSFQDYYYSVSNNRIFLAFAKIPIVQVYDLSGNLLEEMDFNLEGFEPINTSSPQNKWLNAIDGFAVEHLEEDQYNYYFKTVNYQKKEFFLYKIDSENQVTYKSEVTLPTGKMMSTVDNGKWLYMSMSWEDEPIVIKEFIF